MITKIHTVTVENFIVVDDIEIDNENNNDIDIEKMMNKNEILQKLREKYNFNEKKNDFVTFVKLLAHELKKAKKKTKKI